MQCNVTAKIGVFDVVFGILPSRHTDGSSIEYWEMLTRCVPCLQDFCGKHNIVSDIEEIDASYINTAYTRLANNDVHYRFVIDVQGSMVQ